MTLRDFFRTQRGSVAAMGAAGLAMSALAVGGAVDYARLAEARSSLQDAVDSATLGSAIQADEAAGIVRFGAIMASHHTNNPRLDIDLDAMSVTREGVFVTGSAQAEVDLFFGVMTLGQMRATVGATATAAVQPHEVEVALVVDMSSSMIEDGRFVPARDAVHGFIDRFADGEARLEDARIALVPFSSRINPGMSRRHVYGDWNGAPAIPDRWDNPGDYHGSEYVFEYWIDNVTVLARKNDHRRWMGCAEPRLDVSVKRGEATYLPTDAGPGDDPMVAMDHNDQPGLSYCPPPVQPLTADVSRLKRAADALTSQGSTRLDAGMEGGWFALSPNWGDAWGSGHAPVAYDQRETTKAVVFMTDGGMNTMDDPTAWAYDWACDGSADCNADAKASMLATCEAMKSKGIEIYTVSYGQYANRTYVQECASDPTRAFTATTADGSSDYVETIYQKIADKIAEPRAVLID